MRSFNEIYQELYQNIGGQLLELKRKNTGRNIFLIAAIVIFAIINILARKRFFMGYLCYIFYCNILFFSKRLCKICN